MIGMVVAGGSDRDASLVERMLDTMELAIRMVIVPFDGTAFGCDAKRNGFAADIVDGGRTAASVLFLGKLFDEDRPANDPAGRGVRSLQMRPGWTNWVLKT